MADDSHHLHKIIIKIKIIRRVPNKKPFVRKGPLTRINEYIRVPQIRVIDDAGNQLGVMTPAEALVMAQQQDLDLVEIAPTAKPPVCKIMDYGKFQYQQSKVDRVNKGKQKKIDTKGIRIGFRTDTHDLEVKRTMAEKFLQKGQKVKIEIFLRGREKAHQDLARANLERFMKTIAVPFKTEQEVKRYPGGFNTVIAPEIIAS
ncbi:MAG: translation initiation factor IF-3 [Parcubacteria group bacterium]|jgi:translation initiation factor IF-3